MRNSDVSCAFQKISVAVGKGEISTPEHKRRAWRMGVSHLKRTACLSQWLLHCPHVHMAWDHYLVSLVHLRELLDENAKVIEPVLETAESEYELALYVVDPNSTPDPDHPFSIRTLHGPCVSTQFGGGLTDEQAADVTENVVLACIGGYLMPDEDARDLWKNFIAREARRAKGRPSRSPGE